MARVFRGDRQTRNAEGPAIRNHGFAQRQHRAHLWLGGEIARRTTAEWQALLERVDIPYTPARSIEDLLEDPHLRALGFFRTYEHPSEGTMVESGLPGTWSATPLSIRRPPPRLGEHTREVLGAAGLAAAEIEALVAAGAKSRHA